MIKKVVFTSIFLCWPIFMFFPAVTDSTGLVKPVPEDLNYGLGLLKKGELPSLEARAIADAIKSRNLLEKFGMSEGELELLVKTARKNEAVKYFRGIKNRRYPYHVALPMAEMIVNAVMEGLLSWNELEQGMNHFRLQRLVEESKKNKYD